MDPIEQAKIVKSKLDEHEVTKEYVRLKNLFENDEELKRMRRDIARLASEGKEKEADNLRDLYNKHPLVNNYYEAKEEYQHLVSTICNLF